MRLGVFNPILGKRSFADACAFLNEHGVEAIEIGCGGFSATPHCDPKELLQRPDKLEEFQKTLADNHLVISAMSCHGNPVHPNAELAKKYDQELTDTILLCEKLGVDTINEFSGCPGDSPDAQKPNWVTCLWPPDFKEILDYQWNQVLIPYWRKKVCFARAHGVKHIALEMHPGFCVYNNPTLLRLREAVGPEIGANFDPSHLIWQGADIPACIAELGRHRALFHVHAKDTYVSAENTGRKGVLDTESCELSERSWFFRSVGYGKGYDFWRSVVSALRMAGYDSVLSIEHEDPLMSAEEGLCKAIACLQEVLIRQPV